MLTKTRKESNDFLKKQKQKKTLAVHSGFGPGGTSLHRLAVSGIVLHEVLGLLGGDHVDVTHLNTTQTKDCIRKDASYKLECREMFLFFSFTILKFITLFLNLTP